MNTRLRRSLAAVGAATLLSTVGAYSALNDMTTMSAHDDPGGGSCGWVPPGSGCTNPSPHSTDPGSPGVLSGNAATAPIHVPVNTCDTTNPTTGELNPAFGNTCTED